MGYIAGVFFVGGIVVLGRLLRRREREGVWDKDKDSVSGVTWWPLRVPAKKGTPPPD